MLCTYYYSLQVKRAQSAPAPEDVTPTEPEPALAPSPVAPVNTVPATEEPDVPEVHPKYGNLIQLPFYHKVRTTWRTRVGCKMCDLPLEIAFHFVYSLLLVFLNAILVSDSHQAHINVCLDVVRSL